jgi:TATA-binding protein-associated factor Taf7
LERARKDEEEATAIKKEWDELLWRDAEARQWILNLLGEVEEERDLKIAVEGRLMALETRTRQDTTMIEQLHKEQDGLLQTMERLRSEHNTAREERDAAC